MQGRRRDLVLFCSEETGTRTSQGPNYLPLYLPLVLLSKIGCGPVEGDGGHIPDGRVPTEDPKQPRKSSSAVV